MSAKSLILVPTMAAEFDVDSFQEEIARTKLDTSLKLWHKCTKFYIVEAQVWVIKVKIAQPAQ